MKPSPRTSAAKAPSPATSERGLFFFVIGAAESFHETGRQNRDSCVSDGLVAQRVIDLL
jgi:hypothetical protein